MAPGRGSPAATVVTAVRQRIRAAVAGAAARIPADRGEWLALLLGRVEHEPVDFATLARRRTPNAFLMCPPGRCPGAAADAESPVVGVPVDELRSALFLLLEEAPRVRLLAADSVADQYEIEERSRLFGFPDAVTARLYALGENRTTFAIYSRAVYGRYDFGVNAGRARAWARRLAAADRGRSAR